jgi:hypothetical protein
MIRMFAAPRAVFFDIQFLSAGLAPQGVIQMAILFTRQKNHFRLFFAFSHILTHKNFLFYLVIAISRPESGYYTIFSGVGKPLKMILRQ